MEHVRGDEAVERGGGWWWRRRVVGVCAIAARRPGRSQRRGEGLGEDGGRGRPARRDGSAPQLEDREEPASARDGRRERRIRRDDSMRSPATGGGPPPSREDALREAMIRSAASSAEPGVTLQQ